MAKKKRERVRIKIMRYRAYMKMGQGKLMPLSLQHVNEADAYSEAHYYVTYKAEPFNKARRELMIDRIIVVEEELNEESDGNPGSDENDNT